MSARTLRQIVGVPACLHASATLDAAKTAVVLIDYQNEYRSGPLALPDEASPQPPCPPRGLPAGRQGGVPSVMPSAPGAWVIPSSSLSHSTISVSASSE